MAGRDNFAQGNESAARREAGPAVSLEGFDARRHSASQIALMHLVIRRRQIKTGENSFRDIRDSQEDLNDISSHYLSPGGQFLVAESPVGIIGFIGLQKDEYRPDAGALKRLAVLPEYRGRGIGGQLVESMVSWARASGYKSICLSTGRKEKARGIYEKHGFRVVGFDEESQDFLMELNIGEL